MLCSQIVRVSRPHNDLVEYDGYRNSIGALGYVDRCESGLDIMTVCPTTINVERVARS